MKDDGVSANDDKSHAGAGQKLKDAQGIVSTNMNAPLVQVPHPVPPVAFAQRGKQFPARRCNTTKRCKRSRGVKRAVSCNA